jgi:hypothetical protein
VGDVRSAVLAICLKFKELIETHALAEALYTDDGKPRKERIAQKVFFAIADAYCAANGLDISPETNSGRGAVDFKFSMGYVLRVVVEVKLTSNTRLLHGYETQIREYQKAEGTEHAIYLVIDNGGAPNRLAELRRRSAADTQRGLRNVDLITVDGKPTSPASLYTRGQ